MRNKDYSPSMKKIYDPAGKRLTKSMLEGLFGWRLVRENEQEDNGTFSEGFWDQEYFFPQDNRNIKVETELKNKKWFGKEFCTKEDPEPFEYWSIDIPYRKRKNASELFLIGSTGGDMAFLLSKKAADAHMDAYIKRTGKPKMKKTIYESEEAPYYSIPLSLGIFIVMGENGKWEQWQNAC